jgi:hypothetical protein
MVALTLTSHFSPYPASLFLTNLYRLQPLTPCQDSSSLTSTGARNSPLVSLTSTHPYQSTYKPITLTHTHSHKHSPLSALLALTSCFYPALYPSWFLHHPPPPYPPPTQPDYPGKGPEEGQKEDK